MTKKDLINKAEELLANADIGTDECRYYNDGFFDGVSYAFEALSQSAVSECVHPLAELVSGDEGLFCCKCQKYVRSDAHIH